MNNTITATSEVIMHFVLRLEDGSIAESSHRTTRPAKFKMGGGDLTPAIEAQLLGLQVGDKKQFHVAVEDAFGAPRSENIHTLPRSQFPEDLELEEGLIMGFEQPNGVELPGILRSFDDQNAVIDFNHPLAGHAIDMEVEILEILA